MANANPSYSYRQRNLHHGASQAQAGPGSIRDKPYRYVPIFFRVIRFYIVLVSIQPSAFRVSRPATPP